MALLLLHTFAFSYLPRGFWATTSVLLLTKPLKEEAWALNPFSAVGMKLYGFCQGGVTPIDSIVTAVTAGQNFDWLSSAV